jgi:diguanylate cyclase (GGDEF)-like protein
VLALYHADRDAFSRDHLRILNAISSKIALAIDNARRLEQAERTATVDTLTSLPNARGLFVQLDAELARAKRGNTQLSVLALDLNGLKTINERFGQLQGNRVLTQVAARLKASCREYDYVARMGGDEFVLLLPGLRSVDTNERIEEIRYAVASAAMDSLHDQPLTVAIGLAAYPKDGANAESLLAEADRRMYIDKQDHKSGLVHKTVDIFASSSL